MLRITSYNVCYTKLLRLDVSDTANQIVDAVEAAQQLVLLVSEPTEWSPAAAVPESIQELSKDLTARGRALSSSTSELNRLVQIAGQQTRNNFV